MLDTLDAVRAAGRELFGAVPDPSARPTPPDGGVYGLPEWEKAIGPRHGQLDALWRGKGV